jgi:hypothetical protein
VLEPSPRQKQRKIHSSKLNDLIYYRMEGHRHPLSLENPCIYSQLCEHCWQVHMANPIALSFMSYNIYMCITPPLTLILQMAELSTHCMNEDPTNRPEMREIVQKLCKILMSSIEWEASLGGSSQVFTRLFDGRWISFFMEMVDKFLTSKFIVTIKAQAAIVIKTCSFYN